MISINSKLVAEIMGKRHDNLMRAIRADIKTLEKPGMYYTESTYKDGKGQVRSCYEVTIEGCERLAKKLSEEERKAFLGRCREIAGSPVKPDEEKSYTIPEVAKLLGVSERTIQRKVKSGEIKSRKEQYTQVLVKERTIVTAEDLLAYKEGLGNV